MVVVSMTNSTVTIEECIPNHRLKESFALIHQLRPDISEDVFVQRAAQARLEHGYNLFLLFSDNLAIGAIGFRVTLDLCWGKHLYVDDLIVDHSQRRRGVGKHLMEFAEAQARQRGCDCVRLACGLSRVDSQKFYEAIGYRRSSYQFVKACR